MSEENDKLFQRIRNVLYAVSAVLGLSGIVLEEAFIGAISAGIIAVFGIVSDVLAWWYSRRKFVVEPVSGAHSADS